MQADVKMLADILAGSGPWWYSQRSPLLIAFLQEVAPGGSPQRARYWLPLCSKWPLVAGPQGSPPLTAFVQGWPPMAAKGAHC